LFAAAAITLLTLLPCRAMRACEKDARWLAPIRCCHAAAIAARRSLATPDMSAMLMPPLFFFFRFLMPFARY
jgi:hypothetical protein